MTTEDKLNETISLLEQQRRETLRLTESVTNLSRQLIDKENELAAVRRLLDKAYADLEEQKSVDEKLAEFNEQLKQVEAMKRRYEKTIANLSARLVAERGTSRGTDELREGSLAAEPTASRGEFGGDEITVVDGELRIESEVIAFAGERGTSRGTDELREGSFAAEPRTETASRRDLRASPEDCGGRAVRRSPDAAPEDGRAGDGDGFATRGARPGRPAQASGGVSSHLKVDLFADEDDWLIPPPEL